MKYAVVLERGKGNWSAYSPDVHGCAATGKTREETLRVFRQALVIHLRGMKEDGIPLPEPSSEVDVVEV